MIEEQGFKLRLQLTDTIQEVKTKLVEILGDATQYNLIQVERLRSGYCQLLINLNSIENEKMTLKEAQVTHLSTWMIVKDPALRQLLGGGQIIG